MKALVLSDDQALAFYPGAAKPLKEAFEGVWGTDFFKPKLITDIVKDLKDACKVTGKSLEAFMSMCSRLSPDTASYEQQKLIAEALNEGWVADSKDSNQAKWYPVFINSASGFRLYFAGYDLTVSYVGSRQTFKSEKLALYAATQFPEVYKPFFNF